MCSNLLLIFSCQDLKDLLKILCVGVFLQEDVNNILDMFSEVWTAQTLLDYFIHDNVFLKIIFQEQIYVGALLL